MSPYPRPRAQQPFVYGTFLWPSKKKDSGAFYGGLPGDPDIALEILREFGPSELVGKLYTKPAIGEWTLAEFDQIRQTRWYAAFEKTPQLFVFDMQASVPWQVLHFRTESDESGRYVAVALRQFEAGKAPPWIKKIREFVSGRT